MLEFVPPKSLNDAAGECGLLCAIWSIAALPFAVGVSSGDLLLAGLGVLSSIPSSMSRLAMRWTAWRVIPICRLIPAAVRGSRKTAPSTCHQADP